MPRPGRRSEMTKDLSCPLLGIIPVRLPRPRADSESATRRAQEARQDARVLPLPMVAGHGTSMHATLAGPEQANGCWSKCSPSSEHLAK